MSKATGRSRRPKNTVTTKSGKTLKINRSLSDRSKARKAARDTAKAAYLATLPKERWKRTLYRMHPKRVAQYWFSREGGVMALKIIGLSIIFTFFLSIGLFAYFRKDLPKIKDLGGSDLGGSNTYYDRTGTVVLYQDFGVIKRVPVTGDQISPYMKDATVAIEDKDFFKHGAFDVRGILRAAYHDASGSGGAVQGGSTITQQLVKLNEQWTSNRTITRKVKELILATELEREYSKQDILTGYLNTAPYGGVDAGVQTASQDYFQVDAKNLSLAQAAMLAAIPQSPSYYSPYASTQFNPEAGNTFNSGALIGRQHYILDQMATQGYITKQQAAAAKAVDILAQIHAQTSSEQNIKAPYFVLAAKHELEQKYGDATVKRGGWNITTTVDMDAQTKAEQLIASNIANITNRTHGVADDEAMVAEDVQTGQVVALVGGTDFSNTTYGKLNFAATVKVSPGSTFKPYDYTTLIDNNNNVGAGSVLYDSKSAIPGYENTCPHQDTPTTPCPPGTSPALTDYDFLYPGPITLRYALGGSRNVPAVKAMLEAVPNDKDKYKTNSIKKVISTASAMMDNTYDQQHNQNTYNCYAPGADVNNPGPGDIIDCGGSSAIGDGLLLLDDQVNGLSTLARLGQAIPRTYILKITDAAQKTLYQWKQPIAKQVVKADSAYILNDMASDPNASYLPGSCSATTCTSLRAGGFKFQRDNGWQFAVKTGTNNSGFEGLMASWSTKYAVESWVGNHTRNKDLSKYTDMEHLTEPLTRGMMEDLHANLKPQNWVKPTDIKTAPAFVVRNHIHYGDIEPSPTNDLFPSWYTGGGNTGKNTSTTLDKVSNKTATSCTPPAAKDTVYNGNVASWNIDIFNGGHQSVGSSSSGTSSGSTATDDVHNCNDSPPTVTLTAPDSCDTSCTITATVTQGTHPLSDPQYPQFPGTITVTLDGQTIHSENVSDSPSTISFTYTPTSNGSGTLAATVTDSVLYTGSSSTTLNFTVPAPTPVATGITGFTAIITGNLINFNWSGGIPNYSVFRTDNNLPLCPSTPNGNCSASKSLAPHSTPVTISDSAGHTAQTTVQ